MSTSPPKKNRFGDIYMGHKNKKPNVVARSKSSAPAREEKVYMEVIAECERALAIAKSIDPKESIALKNLKEKPTAAKKANDSAANKANDSAFPRNPDKDSLYCTFCKKKRHNRENCWKLQKRGGGEREAAYNTVAQSEEAKEHNTIAGLNTTDIEKLKKLLETLESDSKCTLALTDSYTCQELPVMSKNGMPQRDFVKVGDLVVAHDDIVAGHSNDYDVCPTGLNEIDEYNCFLNVIIQSLWHLRRFRNEILSKLKHKHVGNPCVECVLFDIFTALNTAAVAVPTTSLGTALSSLYPKSNFFQEGQMNDASEVLDVLLDCLHMSFTWPSCVSDPEFVDSNSSGYWACSSSTCIVHSFFGMNVSEEMNCYNCPLKSRRLKYTTFSHDINASALRTVKDMFPESSFDDILNLLEMNHILPCDQEAGGCGKVNNIDHNLSNPPHVFIIVLDWQDTCGDDKIIDKTLRALSTEMNVSSIYRNLDLKNRRSLASMVCYYGKHHYCLAYTHGHKQWMMYDNETVKVIGSWDDVLSMCVKRLLQPQVLFFEAVTS